MSRIEPEPSHEAEVYSALVLGTRDYLGKTGFGKALVALSGGVDSSIVAGLAAEQQGPGFQGFTGKFSLDPAYDESPYARELASAIGSENQREPALVTFLVTASGIAPAGIGSAFWGLVAGVVTLLILRAAGRRA